MSEIVKVLINPYTQSEITYAVGKNSYVDIDGLDFKSTPHVSKIKVFVPRDSTSPMIQVFVEDELYANYENVPFAAFYKTSFHREGAE